MRPKQSLSAILDNARRCAASGNPSAARDAYRRAVSTSGSDTDVLIEFAVFEAGAGRGSSARRLFLKALDARPRDPAIHLNLGELARLSGDCTEAVRRFAEAVALAPADPDAALGLGDALNDLQQFDRAAATLEKAVSLSPDDAEIHAALGRALAGLDRREQAAVCYGRAVRLAPQARAAWIGLARNLLVLGRPSEAADAFSRAHSLAPLTPVLLCRWSRALLNAGRLPDALAKAEEAILGHPHVAEAYQLCGTCLQQMGRFDEAQSSYRRALELDPERTEIYEQLAAMNRARPDDARAIEDLLRSNAEISKAARASAEFALYRIYDRADERERAFQALTRANALKAMVEPFDADRHVGTVEAMIAAFDADFFGSLRPIEWRPDTTPIFILGLPRTGTTLTEQILAHYDAVHPGGEQIPFRGVLAEALDSPREVARRDNAWAERNARSIAATMLRSPTSTRFVTDKTPGNYMAIPFIAWMFPDAPVIHCTRDPRDVGFSCFEQNFRAGVSFAYRLDAFVCAYQCHERIWSHWRRHARIRVLDLCYEDLVRSPETIARRIVEFCGLEWDPRCLDTAAPSRAVQTASFWQVRQPINTRSVGKWRRYEPWLKDFMEQLAAISEP